MSKLRKQISEILVKWSMPTRQVAISEIEALFTSEWERMGNELIGEDLSYIETEDKLGKYMQEDILVINKYKAILRQKLAKLMEGEDDR